MYFLIYKKNLGAGERPICGRKHKLTMHQINRDQLGTTEAVGGPPNQSQPLFFPDYGLLIDRVSDTASY